MKTIRIGGAQGFWGDLNDAPIEMAQKDNVDYISCDYLAELTLSIMQRQKERHPEAGYARDFIKVLKAMLPMVKEKGIKVLTNAGGMNVKSAVDAAKQVIKESGYNLKIGYVLGDDVMDIISYLRKQGISMNNMDTGESIDTILPHMVNANVYYGSEPILECLQGGADIVIVGRSTDTALFLAPLEYEFGWKNGEWDSLATGILTGHLSECGAQATGGNYDYDWKNVPHPEDLGYPIAEISKPGKIVMTKTKDTGGLVTVQSIEEQLFYEIHDPKKYLTPDVVADFSGINLKQIGKDRVLVEGVKGHKRPDTLKLCVGYTEGYRNVAYLPFSWPEAFNKAKRAAQILDDRLVNKRLNAIEKRVEFVGLNSLHGPLAEEIKQELNEVVLRIAIKTKTKEEANKLTPEIAPFILNGPPASCFFGGRTRAAEVFALWPTLIPRDSVKFEAHVEEVK